MRRSNRPPGVFKKRNSYIEVLGELYKKTPKAVLGAMVVSLLTCGGDWLDEDDGQAKTKFLEEWQALYQNGIVPQKPPKS